MRAALLALLLSAAPAGAADWYAEFHAGTTRTEHDDPAITGEERVEGAYGIGVGVEFNKYFSTQLDWHTLGENADYTAPACPIPPCTLTITFIAPEHGWALRALPKLPLGERFAFELGLGLMSWEGDVTDSGVVFSDSGTAAFYSFGASWKFSERWSATVEYQQLEHDFLDFTWTGATLRYQF